MSENEVNEENSGGPSSLSSRKLLLTQEFNNKPAGNIHYNNNSLTSQSSGQAYSLPFVIGQDFNGPNFMAPPQAFILQPISSAANFQTQYNQHHQSFNKKAKIESSGGLIEELASFKSTLRASFDRNLQKLEVLDRLVQTVSLKGNFKIESVRMALDLLISARKICQDLSNDQIAFTVNTISDLRSTLTSEILAKLKNIAISDTSSKIEIIEKLRKEEDSHLTDLTILSTRNKELQSSQKALKDRLERLQSEFQESSSRLAAERDDFKNVVEAISELLNVPGSDSIDAIENLQKQLQASKDGFISVNTSNIEFLRAFLQIVEELRKDFKELSPVSADWNGVVGELINGVCVEMGAAYEQFFCSRERFYNSNINSLNGRIENLLEAQDLLARKALLTKTSLKGQLADEMELNARLRKQFQEVNERFESAASTVERFQFREVDLSKKNEILTEKLRALEHELSLKNQETRTLSIRIQSIQEELDETKNRHRHDICALERKITVLEAKRTSIVKEQEKEMKLIQESDPFSSCNNNNNAGDVTSVSNNVKCSVYEPSTIPSTVTTTTVVKGPRIVVTFTGIRNAQKQKELTSWIEGLGAQVHSGPDFHDDISHVLAPSGHKSIRVLAASLTGKWIVPAEWVEACKHAGHFLPESSHLGFCNSTVRPFRLRSLWMSAAFSATHKSHPLYPTAALRTLLEKLGKARWCEMASQADFLLVTEEEKDSKLIGSSKGVLLTLSNVINMIPIE